MNVYKLFLTTNGLRQVELAQFLDITESAVSNAVRGKSNFSEEKLIKLLQNDKGWDVSMFERPAQSVGDNNSGVVINGGGNHGNIDNRHFYSDSPDVLRAQVELLEERIQEKEERLKEKDAQIKEKDAQIKQLLDIIQGMKQ